MIIVNADDFGRSDGVNRGIEFAHEKGIVTSASLMVRRPAAPEAARYAVHHPDLTVGLHVDLGEWIYRDRQWVSVAEVSGPPREQILDQLAMFRTLVGRDPTHIDSHQHVHREQAVRVELAELAEELGVPLRGYDSRIRYRGDFYGQDGIGTPHHQAISVEALIDLLASLRPGVTELSCHPGLDSDDDLPYGKERSIELQTLCDSRVRTALDALEVELCSFASIGTAQVGRVSDR